MPYKLNHLYRPLSEGTTRYTIVTGGRGSGKSYALACSILDSTYEDGYNILYTRWNLTSAEVSIIPEYVEKMDMVGCRDSFIVHRRDVQNRATGGRVWFRGLQQASKNQIAKLKSLNRIKTWVLDEAQELMSESMFDTIDDSIREKDVLNRVILVLNPEDIHHWIYRRFFVETGVPYDFNGIKGDVTYIHTTWEDNRNNLSQSFIDKAERIKQTNREKYDHLYAGQWLVRREGIIFQNWEEISEAEYPNTLPQFYGNDWGFSNDPNALVRLCYEPTSGTIYIKLIAYRNGMQPGDVARAIMEDAATIGYEAQQCLVYCDPARPEHIKALRTSFGINAMAADNRDKTGRISYVQGFKVKFIGKPIADEVRSYSWLPDPHDADTFTDTPQDGNDHAMDAINYAVTKHLRRQGIVL